MHAHEMKHAATIDHRQGMLEGRARCTRDEENQTMLQECGQPLPNRHVNSSSAILNLFLN
jgi:hypothetical protein